MSPTRIEPAARTAATRLKEDVNRRNPDGSTPLQWAVFEGNLEEAKRLIRAGADIMTMAVGMIVHSDHAEEIVQTGSADLVALGREFLHNPNWPIDAAQKLQVEAPFSGIPPAYAYFLEKRSKLKFGVPSTFQRGMNDTQR